MSYETNCLNRTLKGNPYPGRGIVVGLSESGEKAVFVYFIMGRSANSRNRVFAEYGDEVRTEPFDPSKVEDPSLIIYSPVKVCGKDIVVTNGDQTDTIVESLRAGHCFRHGLMGRRFEPDAPNFTPRISAILHLNGKFSYEMSILKSADGEGTSSNRYFYAYEPVKGVGHFLHTYQGDGTPLPSFEGEPLRVHVPDDLHKYADRIWEGMNEENKISLYCRAIDLKTGETERVLYNKFTR